jgi:hypothetical protein
MYFCSTKPLIAMNTMFKHSLILLSLTLLLGCVNPEYDLGKVEIPDITVPIGDSKKIYLSKILENSVIDDILRADEKTNDYYVVLSEGKFTPPFNLPSAPKTKATLLTTYTDVFSLENFTDAIDNENEQIRTLKENQQIIITSLSEIDGLISFKNVE